MSRDMRIYRGLDFWSVISSCVCEYVRVCMLDGIYMAKWFGSLIHRSQIQVP